MFLPIDKRERLMKKIWVVALWLSAFASFSASAENKLHPADMMDDEQVGVEIFAEKSSYSADYQQAGLYGKHQVDETIVDTKLRYGIAGFWELNAELPYLREDIKTSGALFGDSDEKHNCLGDLRAGAAFKPMTASGEGLDLVAKLNIQPQTADSSTCGNGYTTKSFGLVISEPFGNFRPYIDLNINNRNKGARDSKGFWLGTDWKVSPLLNLQFSYNRENFDASTSYEHTSQDTFSFGAAYAIQKNVWLAAKYRRITTKDFQDIFQSITVSNIKQNVILLGVQILY
jgi:predicted porin